MIRFGLIIGIVMCTFWVSFGSNRPKEGDVLDIVKRIHANISSEKPLYLKLAMGVNSNYSRVKPDTIEIFKDNNLYHYKTKKYSFLNNNYFQVRCEFDLKKLYIGKPLPKTALKLNKMYNSINLDSLFKFGILSYKLIKKSNFNNILEVISKNSFITYEITYNKYSYVPASYVVRYKLNKSFLETRIYFIECRGLSLKDKNIFKENNYFQNKDRKIQLSKKFRHFTIVNI